MPWRSYLLAAYFTVTASKGMSALQISKHMGTTYHTAFYLLRKFRQVMLEQQETQQQMLGEVEVDGAFFGGHVRRLNRVDPKTGKIARIFRYHNRRVVIAIRQRGGRTATAVFAKESDAIEFVRQQVADGATIYTDQAQAWNGLGALHEHMRVNHLTLFKSNRKSTNNCESFYSLLRRKQNGVHHRMSGRWLHLYAAEMAWQVDQKGTSDSDRLRKLLRLILRPIKAMPDGMSHRGVCKASAQTRKGIATTDTLSMPPQTQGGHA